MQAGQFDIKSTIEFWYVSIISFGIYDILSHVAVNHMNRPDSLQQHLEFGYLEHDNG
jgi:hypothetical protein